MTAPRILIAGVGNIFLGDDAFGVEVVQRLARRPLPNGVRVVDFGIRGLDLTYALLEDYDVVLLVDTTARGGRPGTLYVVEPDADAIAEPAGAHLLIEPHGLDPAKVLRLARALGSRVKHVLLVGCEPSPVPEDEEMALGMCDAVRAALDEAVVLVESLVARLGRGEPVTGSAPVPCHHTIPETEADPWQH